MFAGVLKLSRRMRDPVTTMAPPVAVGGVSATAWPVALVGPLDGGICSPSVVFSGVVSPGAALVVCAQAGEAVSATAEIVENNIELRARIARHPLRLARNRRAYWLTARR